MLPPVEGLTLTSVRMVLGAFGHMRSTRQAARRVTIAGNTGRTLLSRNDTAAPISVMVQGVRPVVGFVNFALGPNSDVRPDTSALYDQNYAIPQLVKTIVLKPSESLWASSVGGVTVKVTEIRV